MNSIYFADKSGNALLGTMVTLTILSLVMNGVMANLSATLRHDQNLRSVSHFQAAVDSFTRVLAHDQSCKSTFANFDFTPLLMNTSVPLNVPNPFSTPLLASIAEIQAGLGIVQVSMVEPASSNRLNSNGQTTLTVNLTLTGKKSVFYGNSQIQKTIPVFFTLDSQDQLVDCGVSQPSVNRSLAGN